MVFAPEWRAGPVGRITAAFNVALAFALIAGNALAQNEYTAFDIPAQPLASALEHYSAVTGKDLLYNSNLASGRISKRVHGSMPSDAALILLLGDSGLSTRHLANGSILLSPAPVELEARTSLAVADYYGRIQAVLRGTLCREDKARPGSYRIVLRMSIDAHGRLTRYEQFGSGGSTEADAAIRRALGQLDFGAAPPAELRQPIVMAILPKAPGVTMGCDHVADNATRTAQ